jgi:hypothetical protein
LEREHHPRWAAHHGDSDGKCEGDDGQGRSAEGLGFQRASVALRGQLRHAVQERGGLGNIHSQALQRAENFVPRLPGANRSRGDLDRILRNGGSCPGEAAAADGSPFLRSASVTSAMNFKNPELLPMLSSCV